MLAFAWYLLKVMLCSAILVCYYWMLLRNKKFHNYNRFYLLATLLLSWIIPLFKIEFWQEPSTLPPVVSILTVVTTGNRFIYNTPVRSPFSPDRNIIAACTFTLISIVYLTTFVTAIVRIMLLIRKSSVKKWKDFYLIFSNDNRTPFSFFKYIFLNETIDFNSTEGGYILKHELVHVHEKHSIDKILINAILIAGWYNPFMWLIKKELFMLHEFIADEKAIEDADVSLFANMLLQSAYPGYSFPIANSFFYSPVKRRLLMLTTSKKASYSYARRVLILPLLMFTCMLFAFTLKKAKMGSKSFKASHENIDKNIVSNSLLLPEQLKESAEADTLKKKKEGVTATKINDSLWNITAAEPNRNTVVVSASTIYVDTTKPRKELIIIDGKVSRWDALPEPSQISSITVLKDKSAIEKYGDKGKDGVIEIITKSAVAQNNTKEKYVEQEQTYQGLEKISAENQATYQQAQNKYKRVFTKAENPPVYSKGIVAFSNYIQTNLRYPAEAINKKTQGKALISFVVDENGNLDDFKPISNLGNGIEQEAIRLIKNSSPWTPATQNGRKVDFKVVQEIPFVLSQAMQVSEINTPAQFPGGIEGWRRYIFRNTDFKALNSHIAPGGKYTAIVDFTITKDGTISNVVAKTKAGYGTEEEAVRIISKGPKWLPSEKNQVFVDAPVRQTITYTVTREGWSYVEINNMAVGNEKIVFKTS